MPSLYPEAMKSLHAKSMLLVALCTWVAGCDHPSAGAATAAAGDGALPATSGATTAGPPVVDKAAPGPQFEGSITMTMTMTGTETKKTVMDFEVKGARSRTEQSPPMGDSSYTIQDLTTKTVSMVSDAKKLVTVMELGPGGARRRLGPEEKAGRGADGQDRLRPRLRVRRL